jgi:hypothetical protein
MKHLNLTLIALAFILLYSLSLASAISVDANYITIYPGEQGKVILNIDNNENFDIESVSVNLVLDNLPFSVVGSSERGIDDINEGDDDSVTFNVKASTGIKPGDYNIPYTIKFTNSETDDKLEKEGSFGLRVSAKTEIDFSAEVKGVSTESPIVGQSGKLSLVIINRGLGDIKSLNVKVTPQGYELLSNGDVFIGTLNADDTDLASFDVVYKSTNPKLVAEVTYKDFDNKDQTQQVEIPFKVYTQEQALQLGLIKKSNTFVYFIILIVLIVVWIVWRRMRKRKKKNGG